MSAAKGSERPGRRKGKSGGPGKGNQGYRSQGKAKAGSLSAQPVARRGVPIGKVSRRIWHEVEVEITTAAGKTYLNMREWRTKPTGERYPTKIGLTVPRTQVRKFAKLVTLAADVLEDRPGALTSCQSDQS